jgi:hypothetical protein
MFRKSQRSKAKLRLAIAGVSGSGKTYSALLIASGITDKIVMIDTERGSGDLYDGLVPYDIFSFDPPFDPNKLMEIISAAEKEGYDLLIIDSLSHFWSDVGGVLDVVDKTSATSKGGNKYTAWSKGTEVQNKMVNAILGCKMHVIVTMRSKSAYELVDKAGKKVPQKLGLAPIQRDGLDYEFTSLLEIDKDTHLATSAGGGKDRTNIFDSQPPFIPAKETGELLVEWLKRGVEPEDIKTGIDKEVEEIVARIEKCKATPELDNVKAKYIKPIWGQLSEAQQKNIGDAGTLQAAEIIKKLKASKPKDDPKQLKSLRGEAIAKMDDLGMSKAVRGDTCKTISGDDSIMAVEQMDVAMLTDLNKFLDEKVAEVHAAATDDIPF